MNQKKIFESVVGVLFLGVSLSVMYKYGLGDRKPAYTLSVALEDSLGLQKGTPVYIAGIKVGLIDDICLNTEDWSGQVRLKIHNAYQLPSDTKVQLTRAGLLGRNVISLIPGRAEDFLREGDTIIDILPSQSLETLLQRASHMLPLIMKKFMSPAAPETQSVRADREIPRR